MCSLSYDEKKFLIELKCEDKIIMSQAFKFSQELKNFLDYDEFFIDATSLGFAELLILLYGLNLHRVKNIKIIYAEPKKYTMKKLDSIFNNEFDLTSEFKGFKKIPPFSLLIDSNSSSKAELIVFLGFENNRLERIIENDDAAKYAKYTPVIALPAFVPGWENISLMRHHQEISMFENLYFAPANNPFETNNILIEISRNSNYENLVIAPIGTKPHAIGSMIFIINAKEQSKNIGIVYDFPSKKENRTDGIGNINIYSISTS